jgi:hypothetical protein
VTSGRPPARHLRPRGDGVEQPVTTVELFFDLVYVFAVTRVVAHTPRRPDGRRGRTSGVPAADFADAYAVFRNPAGHRDIEYDDVIEAAEAVQTASLFMRLLDRIERRLAAVPMTPALLRLLVAVLFVGHSGVPTCSRGDVLGRTAGIRARGEKESPEGCVGQCRQGLPRVVPRVPNSADWSRGIPTKGLNTAC